MKQRSVVVLIGASVRAIAQSAHRADFDVMAVDLFGDRDLRAVARDVHVIPWSSYPAQFVDIVRSYPGVPVVYTGGLENHPELIDAFQARGPLWGTPADGVRTVRDVFDIARRLNDRGIRTPATHRSTPEAIDGRWLVKSHAAAGGRHIRVMEGGSIGASEYVQEYVSGVSYGSVFVAGPHGTRLLGTTRQFLMGDSSFARSETPFAYLGSVGPIRLADTLNDWLKRTGSFVGDALGIQGVFGIDWIDSAEGPVLIEINPRYPASAEVIERSTGISIFAHHAHAFTDVPKLPDEHDPIGRQTILGKRIVFSDRHGELARDLMKDGADWSDIPEVGWKVEVGEPVATAFATGQDVAQVWTDLDQRARWLMEEAIRPLSPLGSPAPMANDQSGSGDE